jgi:hypothetical protein
MECFALKSAGGRDDWEQFLTNYQKKFTRSLLFYLACRQICLTKSFCRSLPLLATTQELIDWNLFFNTNNGLLQSIVDKVKGGVQDLSQKIKDAIPSGGNKEGLSGPKKTDEEGYWFDTPSSTGDVTDKARQKASKSRTLDGEETESLQVKFFTTYLF